MTAVNVKNRISLRPLTREDARTVFEWRNMPQIVARATSGRAVSWDEHVRWVEDTVTGDKRRAYIVEDDGRPVGQTRFDRSGERACVISVYLAPGHIGHGIGSFAITEGCRRIFAEWPVEEIVACVQDGNERGRAVFPKCWFDEYRGVERCPPRHHTFLLTRDVFERRNGVKPDGHRATVEHFTALVGRFGQDARAHDWGNKTSQELRFRVLLDALDRPLPKGLSLFDIGCGQGDLLDWLRASGMDVNYEGIDITPAMIEVAKKRFPGAAFKAADLLAEPAPSAPRYDLVVASGIFYKRAVAPFDHMMAMVARFFALARHAVAFNSLSAWATDREPGEFYADPEMVLRRCRALTPWVVLRHDYHPRDFTIYLYREPRRL
jgi:RimJ/RimL family protein N-acetyltransferase